MDSIENNYMPLAPSQVPEWYAYQLDKNSPVYNISFNHFFFKNIDPLIFVNTWQTIMDRHQIFRFRFAYRQGQPMQWLGPPIHLDMQEICIDKRHIAPADIEMEQNRLARELSILPFDFAEGPLFRLQLIMYPEQEYQLIFTIHHILWDETSTMNLLKEFAEIYHAYLQNRQPQPADLPAHYSDYVKWVNEGLAKGIFDEHKRYWLSVYETVPPLLQIPTDFPRTAIQTYDGDTVTFWLPRKLISKIEDYLYKNNITLFIMFMATLSLYFYRLTDQDDFVLGCPFAGRGHPDFQHLLGCFAVPIPIRCRFNEDDNFQDLLNHMKAQIIAAFEHHQYPCTQLIEQLQHNNDLSRPKLFSVMAGVQNNKTELLKVKLGDGYLYTKNIYSAENHGARFDLAIGLDPLGSDIKFFCTYSTGLFQRTTINRMLEAIIYLLENVVENSCDKLINYSIVPERLKRQIVVDFNHTLPLPLKVLSLSASFDQQIAAIPNHPAIMCGSSIITYAHLKRSINQLANYLITRGIKAQDRVAVMFEPGVSMIVALFAVLKLGACYIPITPNIPDTRRQYIINDSSNSR